MRETPNDVGRANVDPARGTPLKHDEIVSEGDAGSAEIEAEMRDEEGEDDPGEDRVEGGSGFVNVGKFDAESILDDGRDPAEPSDGERPSRRADRSVADAFGIDGKHLHRSA